MPTIHSMFRFSVALILTLPSHLYLVSSAETVNDIQSQLNATSVDRIIQPTTAKEIQHAIKQAAKEKKSVSISGGRHAMGGQQFGHGTLLIDMSKMNQVITFDEKKGIIEVQAGIKWPELLNFLTKQQEGKWPQWGIRQKQTGADKLTIGGALSANAHSRGLKMKPIINDVESFTLIDAKGNRKICDRKQNTELFTLAIGGYGLFGVITDVKLRLSPRVKMQRIVEMIDIKDLEKRFEERIRDGFLYGDFQYSTDRNSPDFMRKGVFSCYKQVADDTPISEGKKELSESDWRELYYLAHADRKKAWERYLSFYLTTNGQVYWSDTHQLSLYIDDYHKNVSERMGDKHKATEMITEIDVPRNRHAEFMNDARQYLLDNKADVIYGTVRLVEQDDEGFLTYAQKPFACTIFNLHVVHTPEGLKKAEKDFQALIDLGLKYGGTYFLTYHRWATKGQMEKGYPRFAEFLRLKKKYDPEERFQSEWYRHYKAMFASK